MEIIVQNLINNPENEALFINTYGNFNSRTFYNICESYIKTDDKNDVQEEITKLMKRLRVIHIDSENNFHDYMSCLEAMILGFKKLSLVIIDTFSYYFHDAFVFEKVNGKPLTREMYLNYYLNIFSNLVKQYSITIIYSLPQHLVRQYINSTNYAEGETEAKEQKIYEHMKLAAINNSENRFPIIADLASIDSHNHKPHSHDRHHEKFVEDLTQPDPCSIKKCPSVDIIPEITINESEEFDNNEQEEPILTGQSSDNKSSMHEFRDIINNESSDSLSDANSVKSGEGYKSDTGTESSVASGKLSEKIIATMYRSIKPDVTLKLLNISPNMYMMQITSENQNHGVYFNITENGIIWEITPAEN